ncbi:MAG: glycosyltransferase family 2 protein [Phycisphaerae bacterium]
MKDTFEIDKSSAPAPAGSLQAMVGPAAEPVIVTRAAEPPAAAPLPAPAKVALKPRPTVSFVISTYNRRDVLLETLRRVAECGLTDEEREVIVVDNASTDGTSDAVRREYPMISLLAQEYNTGPVSKNLAIRGARGRYVVFLDDDSYPMPGSVRQMIKHFEADPRLGAAVFTVTLPDGARECSAYPNVFIGCGTGFRRHALEQSGGLPEDFFMQAEEYDLSIRMLQAGWEIRYFDDLHVTHLKSPSSRSAERTTQFDVRNNLILITRYFPKRWVLPYVKDWLRRYRLIAASKGHELAYYKGLLAGLARTMRPSNRRPIDERTFEKLTKVNETELRMARAKKELGINRVVLVDFGKNMLPYYLACKKLGIEVVAISDERLGGHGRRYRRLPIFDDAMCRRFQFDAAIVSNLSPVHAAQRRDAWRQHFESAGDTRPVIDLFEGNLWAGVTFADRASQGFHQTAARTA